MPKNAAATGKADEPNYLDYQENDDDITDGSASGITDGSASGSTDDPNFLDMIECKLIFYLYLR